MMELHTALEAHQCRQERCVDLDKIFQAALAGCCQALFRIPFALQCYILFHKQNINQLRKSGIEFKFLQRNLQMTESNTFSDL